MFPLVPWEWLKEVLPQLHFYVTIISATTTLVFLITGVMMILAAGLVVVEQGLATGLSRMGLYLLLGALLMTVFGLFLAVPLVVVSVGVTLATLIRGLFRAV